MQTDERRRVLFEVAVNFRDLGGYRAGAGRQTRWGRVYRADNLAGLTEADLIRLEGLGLRTLIDFRLPMEREASPDRLPEGSSIRRVEAGFIPAGTLEMLALVKAGTIPAPEIERRVMAQYRLFCVDHTEEHRQTFVVALDPESYPLLLHCTSGKDRTGFAAALLLLALGVSRKTVIEDYNLTNLFRRPVPHLFGPETPEEVTTILLSAQPKYLEAALDEVDRVYGSFDHYLERALGVGDSDRQRLVDLLTEPVMSP
ncbi:MAG: tyrosine-protein phosphatase [Roseiarcus sp.]|uniref:tyrosine-protein phosphatase n=1 Tax=Roseiarcus sp. TaxID=1969460 RepID=UPI003C5A9776